MSDTILLHISAQCQQLIHKKQEKGQSFFLMRMSLNKRRRQPVACQTTVFIGSIGFFEKLFPFVFGFILCHYRSDQRHWVIVEVLLCLVVQVFRFLVGFVKEFYSLALAQFRLALPASVAKSPHNFIKSLRSVLVYQIRSSSSRSSSVILSQLPKPQTVYQSACASR